jgi:hypothetical protein
MGTSIVIQRPIRPQVLQTLRDLRDVILHR